MTIARPRGVTLGVDVLPLRTRRRRILLVARISRYLDQHPVGEVLTSPADISWATDVLVQPDLFVADRTQTATNDWAQVTRLLLTIEVLSPSSVRADRYVKRALYQRLGVERYQLVDADARCIEEWTPGALFPVVQERELRWTPAGATEPLVVALPSPFG